MRIENLERLKAKLRRRLAEAARAAGMSVVVGYSAKHAVFVHENMEPKTLGRNVPRPSGLGVYWGPANYGPKFLEAPARELAPELGLMVRKAMQKKASLATALYAAGLRLQAESQKRVPVEYGALRSSAYTKLETE